MNLRDDGALGKATLPPTPDKKLNEQNGKFWDQEAW